MKIKFKEILIIIIFICLLGTNSYAYSNKYFEIETPSNYQISKSETTFAFDRQDGVVISINILENTNKQNVIEMNYAELQKGYETALEEIGYYDMKTETAKKTTISNIDSIKFKTSAKIKNITAYIESYYITTENYIYGILVISSTNEYFSSIEYKNIVSSIKLLDRNLTIDSNKTNNVTSLEISDDENFLESTAKGILTAIIFMIIIHIIYKKTKKSNKK